MLTYEILVNAMAFHRYVYYPVGCVSASHMGAMEERLIVTSKIKLSIPVM